MLIYVQTYIDIYMKVNVNICRNIYICANIYFSCVYILESQQNIVLRKTRKYFIIRANFNCEVMIDAQSEITCIIYKTMNVESGSNM